MNENIVTGKKYRILKDEIANIWDRISFWTKASDVELNNGTTVENAINTINTSLSNRTVDPKSHASTATTYGVGTTANYGHVKLWTDIYNDPPSDNGYAAAGGSVSTLRTLVHGDIGRLEGNIDGKAPKNHRFSHDDWHSGKVNYGVADSSNFGHVVLRDEYSSLPYGSSGGIAASNKAVFDCYNKLNGDKVSTGQLGTYVDTGPDEVEYQYFYFDHQNGKYGFNVDPTGKRRAAYFHPFENVTLDILKDAKDTPISVPKDTIVKIHTTTKEYRYVFGMFGVTSDSDFRSVALTTTKGTELIHMNNYYGTWVFGVYENVPAGAIFALDSDRNGGPLYGRLYGIAT